MRILETNVAAVGSNAVALYPGAGDSGIRVQVAFDPGITGSVTLYGRINPGLPWVQITSMTTNGIASLGFVEFVMAELTGVSGGGGSAYVKVELAL